MRAKWSMLFGPEGSIILWPKGSILFGQRGQICLAFPTWQNPEQLFVAQELINKVKSKCCGIKGDNINGKIQQLET